MDKRIVYGLPQAVGLMMPCGYDRTTSPSCKQVVCAGCTEYVTVAASDLAALEAQLAEAWSTIRAYRRALTVCRELMGEVCEQQAVVK